MKIINILFFGSTSDSVIVLEKLSAIRYPLATLRVSAVVTQPARPVGRDQVITPTPVEVWAKAHNITVLTFPNNPEKPWAFSNEQQVIDTLEPIRAGLIISACYGQKIPARTISDARFGGLNVHPSILPRWRGGDPVPWAIMSGDRQIGITIVSLSETFDDGLIFAQKKIPITSTDTSGPLRTKLFTIGADLLTILIPMYLTGKAKGKLQQKTNEPRAIRFTRETGFEPWKGINTAMTEGTDADRIERKYRALHPWPGLWTTITNLQSNKVTRLKILKLHIDNGKLVIEEVQLEGKKPVDWEQCKLAYSI